MAYRIPVWYIISTGFQGDRLRVYIKGIMESFLALWPKRLAFLFLLDARFHAGFPFASHL